jgi:hypothetical protein
LTEIFPSKQFFKIVYRKVKRYIPNHKSGVRLALDWWFGVSEGNYQMPKSKTERAIDMVVTMHVSQNVSYISTEEPRGFRVIESFYRDGEPWFDISMSTLDDVGVPDEMPVRTLIYEAVVGKIIPTNLVKPVMHTIRVAHKMLEEEKQQVSA